MNIDTGSDKLLCDITERVMTITINRPEARNALGESVTPPMRRMLAEAANNPAVGTVVITGAGTAFCAGGDVKGMNADQSKPPMPPDERIADLQERQRLLTGAIVSLRKPTIAALPGAAAGAGLAIALACDIRIATTTAFAATGYVRIGLSGDYGIAWLLTRAVGNARARELMFLGDRVDAATGERIGLFNQIVGDDQLQTVTQQLARRLAAGPDLALARIKDNLDDAMTVGFDEARDTEAVRLVETAQHEHHHEAVRAFVEKRAPLFSRDE